MLKLNILPASQKSENNRKKIFFSLKKLFYINIIIFCLYAIVLSVFQINIEKHYLALLEETSNITKESEVYEKRINTINQELDNIKAIQDSFVKWSDVFIYLSQNINDNIKINQIAIDKKQNKINISGFAANRADLLSLKDMLENSSYFDQIDLPIQNLLEKENIDFNISAGFSSYEIN